MELGRLQELNATRQTNVTFTKPHDSRILFWHTKKNDTGTTAGSMKNLYRVYKELKRYLIPLGAYHAELFLHVYMSKCMHDLFMCIPDALRVRPNEAHPQMPSMYSS